MNTQGSDSHSDSAVRCLRLVFASAKSPEPRPDACVIAAEGRDFIAELEAFPAGISSASAASAATRATVDDLRSLEGRSFVGLQVLGPCSSGGQPSILAEVPGEQLLSRVHASLSVPRFELLPTRAAVAGLDPALAQTSRDRPAVDLWVRLPSFFLRLHRRASAREEEGLDGDFAWLGVRLRFDARLRPRIHLGLAAGAATAEFLWIKDSQWWPLGQAGKSEGASELDRSAWFEASARHLGLPTGRSDLRGAAEDALGLRTDLRPGTLRNSRTPLLAYWAPSPNASQPTAGNPPGDEPAYLLRFWRSFACVPGGVDPFLTTDSLDADGTPVLLGLEQRPRRLKEIVASSHALSRRWVIHVTPGRPPCGASQAPVSQPPHQPEVESLGFRELFTGGWSKLVQSWSPNAPRHRTALFELVPGEENSAAALAALFPSYGLATTLQFAAFTPDVDSPAELRCRIHFRVEPSLPFPNATSHSHWTLRFPALRDHTGRPVQARANVWCRTPGMPAEGPESIGRPLHLEVADLDFRQHPTLRVGALDIILGPPATSLKDRKSPHRFWFRRQSIARRSPIYTTQHTVAPLELSHFDIGTPPENAGGGFTRSDAGLSLPVLEVLPGETDRLDGDSDWVPQQTPADPRSAVTQADRWPLLVPLGSWRARDQESRLVLRITETAGQTRPQSLTLRLLKLDRLTPSQKRLLVLVLDRAPFFIGLLDLPRLSDFNLRQGNELAVWSTEGPHRGWQLRISGYEFELHLPPQGIGEAMEKGRAADGYEDIEPDEPVDFRFTPPTRLRLLGSDSQRNYGNTPWNIRSLLNSLDDKDRVGLPLREAQFEMLYGLRFRLANLPNLRLAELLARLGSPRRALDSLPASAEYRINTDLPREAPSPEYENFRASWHALLRVAETRLGIYEIFDERQQEFADNSLPTGFALHGPPGSDQLQAELRKSARLRTSLPEPVPDVPGSRGLRRIDGSSLEDHLSPEGLGRSEWWRNLIPNFEGGLAGSFAWAFESQNLYEMLWQDPRPDTPRVVEAVEASVARLFFSALGGWGTQSATFAAGRAVIAVTVEMGRVTELRVEIIGRIARFWNRARLVTHFRRTVLPTRQFAAQQDPHYGRPILRKAEEYIEFLDKSRVLCDAKTRAAGEALPGALKACICEEKVLVDARWGTDVYDREGPDAKGVGWKLPLRKPGAPRDIYRPANVLLSFHAGSPDSTCEGRIANLDDLWFWVDTRSGRTADTEDWPSIHGLDPLDEVIDDQGNPHDDKTEAQLRWGTRSIPPQAVGATFRMVGLTSEANLTHHIAPPARGGTETPSVGSLLQNVTLGRGNGAEGIQGGIVPSPAIDPVVRLQRQIRSETEHVFDILEQLARPAAGEGASDAGWEHLLCTRLGLPIPDPNQPAPPILAALRDVLEPALQPLHRASESLLDLEQRLLRGTAWFLEQTEAENLSRALENRQKEIAATIHDLIQKPAADPAIFKPHLDGIRAELRSIPARGAPLVAERLRAPLQSARDAVVALRARFEKVRKALNSLQAQVPSVTSQWTNRVLEDLRQLANHALSLQPGVPAPGAGPADPLGSAIDVCLKVHLPDVYQPSPALFRDPPKLTADLETYQGAFAALNALFHPKTESPDKDPSEVFFRALSAELHATAVAHPDGLRTSAEALILRWVRQARGAWTLGSSGPLGKDFLADWRSSIERTQAAVATLADLPASLAESWTRWIHEGGADLQQLENSIREAAAREVAALEAPIAAIERTLGGAHLPLAGLVERLRNHPTLGGLADQVARFFPSTQALGQLEILRSISESKIDAWKQSITALTQPGSGVLDAAGLAQRAREIATELGQGQKAQDIGRDLCRKLSANVRRSFEQAANEVLSLASQTLAGLRNSVDQLRNTNFLLEVQKQDDARKAIASRLRHAAADLARSSQGVLAGTQGTLEQAKTALGDLDAGLRQLQTTLANTEWIIPPTEWTLPAERLRSLARRRVLALQARLDRLIELGQLKWTRGLPGRLELPEARAVTGTILDHLDRFQPSRPDQFAAELTASCVALQKSLADAINAFLDKNGPLQSVRARLDAITNDPSAPGPGAVLVTEIPERLTGLAAALDKPDFTPGDVATLAGRLQSGLATLDERLARTLAEQGDKAAAMLASDCGASLLDINPKAIVERIAERFKRQLDDLKDRIPDLRRLERGTDQVRDWADAQREQLGMVLDRFNSISPLPVATDITQAAQQAFRTFRAFGAVPAVPGLDFRGMGNPLPGFSLDPATALQLRGHLQNLGARVRNVSFAFRKAGEDFQLRMTPVRALVDRATTAAGDAVQSARLKAASLELQVRIIRRKLEADVEALKNKALKDLIPDLGGLKLERLLGAAGLSESFLQRLREKTTIRHGTDPQTLTAYVDSRVDELVLDDSLTLFAIGPVILRLRNVTLTSRIRIETRGGREATKEAYGRLVGDWEFIVGGQALMTYQQAALESRNGQVRMELDPTKIRLASVLQYVSDLMNRVPQRDEGGLRVGLRQDLPREVVGFVKLNLDLPTLGGGTTTIQNLRLGLFLELGLHFPQFPSFRLSHLRISAGVNLAERDAPFIVSFFILGGCGWFTLRVDYLVFFQGEAPQLRVYANIALGVSASLALDVGFARGSVFVSLSLEAECRVGAGSSTSRFSLVLTIAGNLSILGIIDVTVIVTLGVRYATGRPLEGFGRIVVRVKICWCFTLKVDRSFTCRLGGGRNRQDAARLRHSPSDARLAAARSSASPFSAWNHQQRAPETVSLRRPPGLQNLHRRAARGVV